VFGSARVVTFAAFGAPAPKRDSFRGMRSNPAAASAPPPCAVPDGAGPMLDWRSRKKILAWDLSGVLLCVRTPPRQTR
jgi:hypothetical protein